MPKKSISTHAPDLFQNDAKEQSVLAKLTPIIEAIPVVNLKPAPTNARVHSKKQIREIAASIREFGFTVPALIDENNLLLAGHGRMAAAKLIGLQAIPCVRISNLTEIQKRAFRLADNRIALNARWDEGLLAQELEALLALDTGFDLSVTGFTIPEIDGLIASQNPENPGAPQDDFIPDQGAIKRRCNPGDIYRLGPHRLICGDARDRETVSALMNGELARMIFADPPFNVKIQGNVGGLGNIKHGEFFMASGEMTPSEFTAFLKASFTNLVTFSHDGSIHFICMDWRHLNETLQASDDVYTEFKNLIVWVKTNAGMGSFFRSQHEMIFVFKKGTAPHINNFELGQHGRHRTNVWTYGGASSFKSNRLKELALHPTVKPVALVADAILDVSARNDIVLDTFGGSGSTLIAAHKTGRRGYLCEIDPIYCDKIIARFEAFAHEDAEFVENILSASKDEEDGQ